MYYHLLTKICSNGNLVKYVQLLYEVSQESRSVTMANESNDSNQQLEISNGNGNN